MGRCSEEDGMGDTTLALDEAFERMAAASCPYSSATRGNIDVELSVDGVLLPTAANLSPLARNLVP
jgi:hypothetical protein